ncbi:glycosyltransferase [Yoonia litorea]|uniref:Glycosyltransferase involved in cell wall bisynthesis n=1 Tax=Yoonia litorea TaxID=1123755 RepID=A0A1I6LDX8_9RHOB|nr:glycosyltransferase [Yoonia litorea]SFS01626.1 Glycosyltransferase involved in cell wall bisynthesis [Yoonia litorea]
MKILHITPSFFPATFWGGPIWSTKAICDGIAQTEGFDLSVMSSDAAGLRVSDRVVPVGLPYPVRYFRRVAGHAFAPAMFASLPGAIAAADVVHITGVFSAPTLPTLALCKVFGKPLIWSPRGAIQATEAWGDCPRRGQKRAFLQLARMLMPAAVVLHATSASEAEANTAVFRHASSCTIPNAVTLPPAVPRHAEQDALRLMFLGRLHPKKGLDLLIKAMDALPRSVSLDIYGDGSPDDLAALQTLAGRVGQRVRFHGHVEGQAKWDAFARADLFVLPSHSENFGIAIAEALAHCVPVLTTDATPWQDLDRHGCGRAISLQTDDLATVILQMGQEDLPAMGQRGRAWMQRDFAPEAMVARFADLYRGLSRLALAGQAA